MAVDTMVKVIKNRFGDEVGNMLCHKIRANALVLKGRVATYVSENALETEWLPDDLYQELGRLFVSYLHELK